MDKLGIELPLLLTQVVNFTIMLIILTKLLYKPILKGLRERREKIAEGLAASEKAKIEAEKITKKREEIIKEAREEVRVILENAQKEAKLVKDEIVADGKKEATLFKEKTEKEMATKYKEMTGAAMAHTVDIATAMVKQLLPQVLTEKNQHELVTRELKKLERIHAKQ